MEEKKLTGRIAREKIKLMHVPRPPQGAVAAFLALGDATGIVSDAMDELGIPCGVVGAHVLKPTIPGTVIVGPALTIRNVAQRTDALEGARARVNKMAEHEGHNLATPGDVLVIEGVPNASNLGGISAQTGKRQGEVGAIVSGGIRDIAHQRAVGYPVWASAFTAMTGKWRLETVEINGAVQIEDVRVEAGDLVVADDTAVCFVPREKILDVLALAQKKAKAEQIRCAGIDKGISIHDLLRPGYGETER
jgi:4-hydroxy-4-methyl-2-oxoglutarate aldolase